jgi:hypothetical protein
MSIINKHSSLLFWLSNKSCFPSTPILSSVLVPYFANNTNLPDTLIGGQVGDFRSPHINSIGTSMCSIFPPKQRACWHFSFTIQHSIFSHNYCTASTGSLFTKPVNFFYIDVRMCVTPFKREDKDTILLCRFGAIVQKGCKTSIMI